MKPSYEFRKDGTITWVGDAEHLGTDVYWSDRLQMWVFVDLANRRAEFAERFLVAESTQPGEITGLRQICLASNRDGACTTWVISVDSETARQKDETLEFLFDSNSLE